MALIAGAVEVKGEKQLLQVPFVYTHEQWHTLSHTKKQVSKLTNRDEGLGYGAMCLEGEGWEDYTELSLILSRLSLAFCPLTYGNKCVCIEYCQE